jgi:hypothetical protein
MKVSRNSLCPCGSGQKYKICCLNSGGRIAVPVPGLQAKPRYDLKMLHTLAVFTTLQGLPENSTRLTALQRMTFTRLKSENSDDDRFKYHKLHTTFFNELWLKAAVHNKPDVFSTNVTSFLGNTTMMPGLLKGGGLLLQTLLNVIFLDQLNEFPKGFYEEAYAATYFILKIASAYAEENEIKPFDDTIIRFESIFIPDEAVFNKAFDSCLFNKQAINETFRNKQLPLAVIEEFLLKPDALPENFEQGENELMLHPLLDAGKAYLLLSPVNLLSALYFYLWRAAVKHDCVSKISELYNEEAALNSRNNTFHLDWRRSSVASALFNELNISLFEIDTDKLAILIYVPDGVSAADYVITNPVKRLAGPDIGSFLEGQIAAINERLDHSAYHSFPRLFIAVIGNTGREDAVQMDLPDHPFLIFAYQDWVTLCRGRDDYHRLYLWYFYHAKERFMADYDTDGMSLLEMFALYMEHKESFYLANEAFDIYEPDPSLAPQLLTVAERRSAAMVLPYQEGSVPPIIFIPVLVLDKYDEVYMPDPVTGRLQEYAITGYPQTIWFKPADQGEFLTYGDDDQVFFTELVKMVAYWIKQAKVLLAEHLRHLPLEIIEVFVAITDPERFFQPIMEKAAFPDGHRPVTARIIEKGILLEFNSAFAELLEVPDNRAERLFLQTLLTVINNVFKVSGVLRSLAPLDIPMILANVAPLGRKKKFTIFNRVKDVRMLGNHLGRIKYLRSYQTNRVLDELTASLDADFLESLPEITDKEEKLKFLGNLVFKVLIPRLRDLLKPVDTELLLARLIGHYEKLIHKKKTQEVNIPTVKYCYPDIFDTFIEDVHANNSEINETSIAYRCLIEFISAEQHGGSGIIADELIDELLAIMITIVDLGVINDQLYFDLSTDHLSILSSGRIGFQRHFLQDFVHPYQRRQTENIIESFHEDFDSFFADEMIDPVERGKSSALVSQINEAYQEAHGFTFEQLVYFLIDISHAGLEQQTSYAWLYRNDLIDMVLQKQPALHLKQVNDMLQLMCMLHRGNALKVPKGIDNYEASPWRYNRLLSYLSKPLIVIADDTRQDNPKIYFGIRHLVDVADQMQVRIMEGRLRDPKLATLSGVMLDRKGKVFNRVLADWIKHNSTLVVISELALPGTLGDIDVLVIDETSKRLYLIEAKNTTPSKVAKEMAEERDRFLVSDGDGPGWMKKHLIRYQSIKDDISILNIRTQINLTEYAIIPLFITLQDILIPYLLSSNKFDPELNMPMFSFDYLKDEGTQVLTGLTYNAIS